MLVDAEVAVSGSSFAILSQEIVQGRGRARGRAYTGGLKAF